ncbi:MAG TPA: tRNA (adenosine(37)-N6)-threonylcarbamoyltransferase complex ATPase subunit type 1 TsaE [Feifaniaceae bacterium]|nr:tRNA (adenosine(37)-N6)-threonylcarbamoyltransferase complex ATPase subunit type 1 TsaE [Feifaniaceae bacterium]
MNVRIVTRSAEETTALGERIAGLLFPGAFLALSGDLGAGKTALSQGIGKGLGVSGVTSPTFTILQEHEGSLPLYHFDAYRLKNAQGLYDVGFSEYVSGEGVILMEWPENVAEALPKGRLAILIEGSGDAPRTITLHATDARHQAIPDALQKEGEPC